MEFYRGSAALDQVGYNSDALEPLPFWVRLSFRVLSIEELPFMAGKADFVGKESFEDLEKISFTE